MYITYRYQNNREYWTKRWTAIPADEAMQNTEVYPLKYALACNLNPEQSILEAGCGNGRVLRYFKERGYNIKGMDFIPEAVDKLKQADPELDVEVGDITNLKYADESFDCILAFGLYHNLRDDALEQAIKETMRVMKKGGKLCASFRADNIANRVNDLYANFKARKKLSTLRKKNIKAREVKEFHKLNLTEKEFCNLVTQGGGYI